MLEVFFLIRKYLTVVFVTDRWVCFYSTRASLTGVGHYHAAGPPWLDDADGGQENCDVAEHRLTSTTYRPQQMQWKMFSSYNTI